MTISQIELNDEDYALVLGRNIQAEHLHIGQEFFGRIKDALINRGVNKTRAELIAGRTISEISAQSGLFYETSLSTNQCIVLNHNGRRYQIPARLLLHMIEEKQSVLMGENK